MRFIVFSVKGIVQMGSKILLLKRSSDHKYCPRCWELPGGKIESLNFKKEFVREAKEEGGLRVSNVTYKGMLWKKSARYKTIFGWSAWHCTFFVGAVYSSQAVKLSREHSESAWFSRWHFKSLTVTPETEYALAKYIKK